MEKPLKITSRDFELNAMFEAEIREKAAALDTYYPRIGGCEVTVRAPNLTHHKKGGPFVVAIRLTVPGKEIVVDHQAEEELSQAIREAFDAVRRRLEDHAREQRGAVKIHGGSEVGTVTSLEPELDHGFLETSDGREIYFHRNSVVGSGFDHLQVGSKVRFAEEEGEKGPQASSVVAA